MKRTLTLLTVAIFMLFGMTIAKAAEDQPKADESKYSIGTVVSATDKELKVSEYDFETDQDVEVVYQVNESTKKENFNALSELAQYDEVEIEYQDQGGTRTALHVLKIADEQTEGAAPVAGEGMMMKDEAPANEEMGAPEETMPEAPAPEETPAPEAAPAAEEAK